MIDELLFMTFCKKLAKAKQIRFSRVLPEREGGGEKGVGTGVGGRNDPNNVCTCE
jgi:hypothetical protein